MLELLEYIQDLRPSLSIILNICDMLMQEDWDSSQDLKGRTRLRWTTTLEPVITKEILVRQACKLFKSGDDKILTTTPFIHMTIIFHSIP